MKACSIQPHKAAYRVCLVWAARRRCGSETNHPESCRGGGSCQQRNSIHSHRARF